MELSPKVSWFLKYLGIFFIIPIIGTLAHELGHFLVAVIYQQPAGIAYAYTYLIGSNILTPEQWLWFILGGPISTWTVAALGISIILWKYRSMHDEQTKQIGVGQSVAVLATSFGLRFIFNAGVYFISTTLLGNSSGADEVEIAKILGISHDLMMYGSAIIALLLILTALYYLPRHQRYIILIGGIIGGILGYLFWYYWIGPIVLPLP
jgi:hypothetical protein